MKKTIIETPLAPSAIGAYSQAVKVDNTVYISGQIPLEPETMQVCAGDFKAQLSQVFDNLNAVATAAGGSLADIVKLQVYLTDLNDFSALNEVFDQRLAAPFPARAAVEVSALPKGVAVEMDAVLVLAD